eukprot:jgi/Mesvir1/8824/Mv02725-RA.1
MALYHASCCSTNAILGSLQRPHHVLRQSPQVSSNPSKYRKAFSVSDPARPLDRRCFARIEKAGLSDPGTAVTFTESDGESRVRYSLDSQSGIWERRSDEFQAATKQGDSRAGQDYGIIRPQPEPGLKSAFASYQKMFSDFLLPAGYPDSVTPDYLPFMLWQLPCHITGWMSKVLVTSSLLKAIGFGGGAAAAAGAAGASATIKWVSKDGLGAVGRLIVGGQFGRVFDEDPRTWRMYGEALRLLGSFMELCTPLVPDYFIVLASLGTLAKAAGKGFARPPFRVIQNHMAAADNIGNLSAKEEVWEVFGELLGVGLGALLLNAIVGDGRDPATEYQNVVIGWVALTAVHLWTRYKAMQVVCFDTLNMRRAVMVVSQHVKEGRVSTPKHVNHEEPFLMGVGFLRPQVHLGVTLEQALGGDLTTAGALGLGDMVEWTSIFRNEKYLLVWRDGRAWVVLKEGAVDKDILRALWQASWICHRTGDHLDGSSQPALPSMPLSYTLTSSVRESTEGASSQAVLQATKSHASEKATVNGPKSAGVARLPSGLSSLGCLGLLRESTAAMEGAFPRFEEECGRAGWVLEAPQLLWTMVKPYRVSLSYR